MRTRLLLIILLLFSGTVLAQEPLFRQLNLSEMTDAAGTIARVRVLEVRTEPHPDYPNISTLRVSVQVLDRITGGSEQRISFRLYLAGGRFTRSAGKSETVSAGFRVGDELVLFMHQESRLGFSSPVGGEQGRFVVRREDGKALVANSLDNRGLFSGVGESAKNKGVALGAAQAQLTKQTSGAVDMDTFMSLVRQLAAKKVTK